MSEGKTLMHVFQEEQQSKTTSQFANRLGVEIQNIRTAVAQINKEKQMKKDSLAKHVSDMVNEDWTKQSEAILKWFEYQHLPDHLQQTSMLFGTLATTLASTLEPGRERTVALRKLLEAKDAAVRATIAPGG